MLLFCCHSRVPMACSIDLKLNVTSISIEQSQNLLVTGNKDKTIKVRELLLYSVGH